MGLCNFCVFSACQKWIKNHSCTWSPCSSRAFLQPCIVVQVWSQLQTKLFHPRPPPTNGAFALKFLLEKIPWTHFCLCDHFYPAFIQSSLGENTAFNKTCDIAAILRNWRRGIFLSLFEELYILLLFLYWLFHFYFDNSGAFDNSIKSWQIGRTDWAISQSAHPHSRYRLSQGRTNFILRESWSLQRFPSTPIAPNAQLELIFAKIFFNFFPILAPEQKYENKFQKPVFIAHSVSLVLLPNWMMIRQN